MNFRDYNEQTDGTLKQIGTNIFLTDLTNCYFFSDESYDLNGPYSSLDECKEGLKKYVEYLNGKFDESFS